MTQPPSQNYPAAIAELLSNPPLMPLGPGRPAADYLDKLQALTAASITGNRKVADQTMAQCAISGLWLLYNYLDESHEISQGIHSAEGSYWHAIMHRREPDAWNSMYWFRRVGTHSIFNTLAAAARDACQEAGLTDGAFETLAHAPDWQPQRFVDLCEQTRGQNNDAETLCRQIQLREWRLLFDYCWQRAYQT